MKRIIQSAVIVFISLGLCASASAAQTNSHDDSSTTRTTVLFAPGLALAMPFLTTTGGISTSTATTVWTTMTSTRALWCHGRASAAATVYLRENHRELSASVLLGGGEAMDDLASLLDVPEEHYEQFARDVRAQRDELLPHLHEELDQDDATAFLTTLAASSDVVEGA